MNLRSLDLNLLVALDALLVERSVTRAATRLAISQPSMSASLSRLRRHFGDELLHRVGNQYELTPLGGRLNRMVGDVLHGAERVFGSQATFDPETSERQVTVVASDYAMAVAIQALCADLDRHAPGMHVRVRHITPEFVGQGDEGFRAVDGVFMPHGFLPDLPHTDLYQDRWVCVVATENPEVGERLTLADLARLPWVDAFGGPRGSTPAARQLQLLGVEPVVQVTADSFLGVPFLVAGTRRIALLQERLARRIADRPDLRILDCPFEAVPLVEAFWWHPVYEHDIEHAWLRERLAVVARELDGEVLDQPVPGRSG
ncbi:LysR family transcriptional regulator [Amycolatopsis sp. NPDC098790]|uniref:LysR family transcriptional regulator n=1 Tax=Amycolatopsis sp. NPDC098790 TaxID=3363939 RepID=UPI0037F8E4DE